MKSTQSIVSRYEKIWQLADKLSKKEIPNNEELIFKRRDEHIKNMIELLQVIELKGGI